MSAVAPTPQSILDADTGPELMPAGFVHLRVHSQFSLEDGLAKPETLVEQARKLGMPALAITDWHNLFGLVKFYRAAQKAGIKPIVGADVRINDPKQPEQASAATLLVQHRDGYLNLCRLLSSSFIDGRHRGHARVHRHWLTQADNTGLIVLLGWDSDVGQALRDGFADEAEQRLQQWHQAFGDRLYIELQRTGREAEAQAESGLLGLAASLQLPVVASNDVRFASADQYLAHEARVCIHQGWLLDSDRRSHDFIDQQYLKSPQEMGALFADLPVALDNTVELAKRLNLEIELG
ncbi:MAG: PHP domain-containing protein, partial [Pseudomonadota bacterium]